MEEDQLMDGDRAKLAALRVCTNRVFACRKADNALESVMPILQMFVGILSQVGMVKEGTDEGWVLLLFKSKHC